MLLICIILLKNHSFNIQKYGLSMYFSTKQKITLFFYRLFAYVDFRVLKKYFIIYYLPLNPVILIWDGSRNQ